MTSHVSVCPMEPGDIVVLRCARCGAERLREGDPDLALRDFEREHRTCEREDFRR